MKSRASLLLILGALLLLAGCREFGCCSKILSQAKSPDTLLEVTVVEGDCGATTPFFTRVMLHRPVDDYRDGNVLFNVKGQPMVKATWVDNKTLRINCSCAEENVYMQVVKQGGTTIQYTFSGSVGPGIS